MELLAPSPLTAEHAVDDFSSGEPTLDQWLKRRALSNQLSGASRTFVCADRAERVLGFYAIAAGAVSHQLASAAIRRNMPDPVPVMVLGRLAVDQRAQGIQLGGALLRDAVTRTLSVAENAGVRALMVHAINESAKQFYEHYGFQESPHQPMTLMLRLNRSRLKDKHSK